MKYTLQILVLTMMLGGLYACQGGQANYGHSHEHQETKQTEEKAKEKAKDVHKHADKALRLNDGKKWQANPETTEGIAAMSKLMIAFASNETGNYKSLKTDLEKEFQTIFKKCTMKGEAHNQLHNYLLPMKKLFGGLDSDSPTAQKTTFEQLNKHLAVYAQYFE